MNFPNIYYQGPVIEKAEKALILLHGRGGTARGILELADQTCDASVHIMAPQAPDKMWYPYNFMAEDELNEPFLSQSIEWIKHLIDETAAHMPLEKLYLMGFSQGACLALEVASRFAAKYGGVFAFTGGLIGQTIQPDRYQGNFEGTPVFIGNSDQDPYVPLHRSRQSKDLMEKHGAHATLKVYPGMDHVINQDEIDWAKKYLHH